VAKTAGKPWPGECSLVAAKKKRDKLHGLSRRLLSSIGWGLVPSAAIASAITSASATTTVAASAAITAAATTAAATATWFAWSGFVYFDIAATDCRAVQVLDRLFRLLAVCHLDKRKAS
jgi:tRNA A37 threonylcarbamoyladenosine synthetase subunit TsaC/SUA5/YrdC